MADEANTAAGSKILRYEKHAHEYRPPEREAKHVEELTDFLTSFLGPSKVVWHEIVSDKVHLDVLTFPPHGERPFWTFVTSGMSDLPMNVPAGIEDGNRHQYAEMVISLPAEWFPTNEASLDRDDFTEENYWPIRLVKWLARFPHEYGAWISRFHSFPNGSPAQPYGPNTRMSGAILLPPATWPLEKWAFQRSDGATVNFLAVYPLYDEEMTIKLSKGSDVLFKMIAKSGITEILDPDRPNLARKRKLWDLFRN